MRLKAKIWLRERDYKFRSEKLARFPLYFFMSACEHHTRFGRDSLHWVEFPSRVEGGEPLRQFSYNTDPVLSRKVAPLPLLTPSRETIHRYGYYARLRLHSAWRVPVLHGKIPRFPEESAPAESKGKYALCAMLLFARHRN